MDVESLKQKYADGSITPFEIGALAQLTGQPLDFNQQLWANANDAQRKALIDTAAGYETEAQRKARIQGTIDTLINKGDINSFVTDPRYIGKVAGYIANGESPPDYMVKPNALNIMAQVAYYEKFSEQVPSDIAAKMATAAAWGNDPMAVLPTGTQSFAQIDTSANALNANANWLSANAAWVAANAKAATDPEIQKWLDIINQAAIAEKAGLDYDEDLVEQAWKALFESVGIRKNERPSAIWGWVKNGIGELFGTDTASRQGATEGEVNAMVGNMPGGGGTVESPTRPIDQIVASGPQNDAEAAELRKYMDAQYKQKEKEAEAANIRARREALQGGR